MNKRNKFENAYIHHDARVTSEYYSPSKRIGNGIFKLLGHHDRCNENIYTYVYIVYIFNTVMTIYECAGQGVPRSG